MGISQFDQQSVVDWNATASKWVVAEQAFDQDFPSTPQSSVSANASLAKWIIETIFGLQTEGIGSAGGPLKGYDIKGRDAYEMIRLSLAEELTGGDLYECYANNEGKVIFVKVGGNSASFGSRILYSVPSATYKIPCKNVIVVGYDKPPKRYTGPEKNLLTFANTIPQESSAAFTDPDHGSYPKFHIFEDVLGTEDCPYTGEGIIEYGGNPEQLAAISPTAFHTGQSKVYDPTKFEKVLSYFYKIKVPFFDPAQSEVTFSAKSVRYKELTSMGKLQSRNFISNANYAPQICLNGQAVQLGDGVGVKIPDSDSPKFLGVKDIYIHGYRLKGIRVEEDVTTNSEGQLSFTRGSTKFRVMLDTMIDEPIRLQEGEDYIVVPDSSSSTGGQTSYKVAFICNVADPWLDQFGQDFGQGGHTTFKIEKSSIVSKTPETPATRTINNETGVVTGYLKDFRSRQNDSTVNSDTSYTKTIFPTGEGSTGYVVSKVVVVCEWDNPSILVRDKRPNIVTEANLRTIEAHFTPIIIKDPPPPIAFNGNLLDPSEIQPDYDPNTQQNFTATTYVKAFSSLEASDIKVTMPFADEDDVKAISNTIKTIQNDTADEVVYICKPHVDVELGDKYAGGIVNAIDYNYQDSSQYYISVTVGPKWRGFGGSWDNSVYKMNAERLQFEGVVIQTYESNSKCQVDVNKIGIMECINATKYILQKGDIVSVTIYNNPVSYFSQ